MIKLLNNLAKSFDVLGKTAVEKMAVSGQSLLQARIQSLGVKGVKYSSNKLPIWYLEDKALNAGGRAYVEKKKQENEQGDYIGFRRANGRQTDKVDLTFSSRMWAGFKLIRVFAEGSNRFAAYTGGTDEETDKKIGWQMDRYGRTVFDSTPEEIEEVNEIASDFIEDFINNLTDE